MWGFKRNDLATINVRGLTPECTEPIIYELFAQFGNIKNVFWSNDIPDIDEIGSGTQVGKKNYCFIEYSCAAEAQYCAKAMAGGNVKLYGSPISVSCRYGGMKAGNNLFEVGAKLFVRNLDKNVTAVQVTGLFGKFGPLAVPVQVLTDDEGRSRGCAVVSYEDFSSSDRAVETMHRQVFENRIIEVEYANKNDGSGEKHGGEEERANAQLLKEKQAEHQEQARVATQQAQTVSATSWASNINPYAQRQGF